MKTINQVTTTNWQISNTGIGDIAEDADDINQCINNIFSTQRGSDPFRPDFGLDLLAAIDRPVNIMAPDLISDMVDQVASYETRIDLKTVNYTLANNKVVFALTWEYSDGTLYKGDLTNKAYFLLADQNGLILLSDFDVSLILN
jgi:phage baseplate assembly protein W